MRILCLFPGQGSQQWDFFDGFQESSWESSAYNAKKALEEWRGSHSHSKDIQAHIVGTSLWVFEQLKSVLENHEVWLGGHSLGELTATSINLGWDQNQSLSLAQKREQLMKEISPENSEIYAVLGSIDRNALGDLCDHENGPWLMNDNGWEQVVVGGKSGTEALLSTLGAKRILRLPMGVLSHCKAMEPMCELFKPYLSSVLDKHSPLYPQVFCRSLEKTIDPAMLKDNLVQQLTSSVRFRELIESVNPDLFIEVGPNSVLSGLIRKIKPGAKVFRTSNAQSLSEVILYLEKEVMLS